MSGGNRLVLGAAQFGQQYGSGSHRESPDQSTVAEILRAAAAHSVSAIDTARAYGDSEHLIGECSGDATVAAVPVVTKIQPLGAAATSRQELGRAVRDSFDRSLAALQRSEIDTVLLHRAQDVLLHQGAAVDVLRDLIRQRRVRRWGVSAGSPAELLDVLSFPDLGYVQVPFNLLDRRLLAPAVQSALAARPEVCVTARSAFLQGLLTGGNDRAWPTTDYLSPVAVVDILDTLSAQLSRQSRADLCLGYVLGQPWITAVVVGVRSVNQLELVVRLTDATPLNQAQRAMVEAALPGAPEDLVNPARWPQPAASLPPSERSMP